MHKLFIRSFFLPLCAFLMVPAIAAAQAQTTVPSTTTAGLTISPVRSNPIMAPGENRTQKLTVQNRSAHQMNVVLTYEQFSLTNETYNYTFTNPPADIITFETDQFTLDAGMSRVIAYQISIPASFSAGGSYYTIFATSKKVNGSITTESRVGSLLFITIDGPLDRTTGITKATAPNFTVSAHIPISLKLENTGNVHSENTVTTKLDGTFMSPQTTTSLHLVMPGTTRIITYDIAAPRFPGIYSIQITANNGYTQSTATTLQVAYVPVWCFALVALLIALVTYIVRRRKRIKTTNSATKEVKGSASDKYNHPPKDS